MNEELLNQYAQYIKIDYIPTTADEYIDIFRALAALTNHTFDYLENTQGASTEDFQQSVNSAAHMVESLALMRGERGALLEGIRPSFVDTDYQSEMYKVEDYFRYRLTRLGYAYKV